jgi:hypothetical protein
MPLVRYALGAAAASLIAGAALAQATSSPDAAAASGPPPATDNSASGATNNAPPPAAASTGAGTETSAVVNGQTVQVIASAPVPDTPENRAKYGQPLSRAGKRTAPKGN